MLLAGCALCQAPLQDSVDEMEVLMIQVPNITVGLAACKSQRIPKDFFLHENISEHIRTVRTVIFREHVL